jgi:hypothetical protein
VLPVTAPGIQASPFWDMPDDFGLYQRAIALPVPAHGSPAESQAARSILPLRPRVSGALRVSGEVRAPEPPGH